MKQLKLHDLDVLVRVRTGQTDGPALAAAALARHQLQVWDPDLPALAARFRVLRPDMRGHGGTPVTPGPYSIAQLGADALGVLDALGIATAPTWSGSRSAA